MPTDEQPVAPASSAPGVSDTKEPPERPWERFVRDRPVAIVSVLAALVVGAGILVMGHPPELCKPLPVTLNRLEVTYSLHRFVTQLFAEGACREYAIEGLGWRDIVFAAVYPFFLSAAFLWIERWRQRQPGHDNQASTHQSTARWRFFGAVAPFLAGGSDIIEDLALWFTALATPESSQAQFLAGSHPWLVFGVVVGSIFATLKWFLLVLWVVTSIRELFTGPRGQVLRVNRFSALAVALGAVPLIVTSQGMDILQRLGESPEHPFVRMWAAVAGVLFTAFVVWYSARRILEAGFVRPADPVEDPGHLWFDFFARYIPRILGTAMPLLVGLAFANVALASGRFLTITILGFVLLGYLTRRAKKQKKAGQRAVRVKATATGPVPVGDALRDEGIGRLLIPAIVTIALTFLMVWWPLSSGSSADPNNDLFPSDVSRALRLGAALCLTGAWVFYFLVRFRRVVQAARATSGDFATRRRDREIAAYTPQVSSQANGKQGRLEGKRAALAAAALSGVLFLTFTFVPVPVGRFLGPLIVLALFASNAVFFGSIAVYIYEHYRFPVVRVALGLALLFGLWNENHNVRRLTAAGLPPRDRLESRLDRLMTQQSSGPGAPKKPPIVLVAAAGGGLRAAYWAAMTLAAIQDSNPQFSSRVLAMSGVSGGSLGVALFAALVHDSARAKIAQTCGVARAGDNLPGPFSRCTSRYFSDDFLSPVLGKLLVPDLAQRFWPISVERFDRSTGLEQAWEASYLSTVNESTFAQGLAALGRGNQATPALLLNSTHVESGKRYVASSVDSTSALPDTREELSLLNSDVRISTAVHNSARFPYVSPAGHLDRDDGVELGRVVDGGYFENSGLVTLRELADLIHKRDSTQKVIALYLCNDPPACRRDEITDSIRRGSLGGSTTVDSLVKTHATAANELLSPVRAVLAARDARGELALAYLRETPYLTLLELSVCDRLTPVPQNADTALKVSSDTARARERVVSPPLGWLLSRQSRTWMDKSLSHRANGGNDKSCPATNRKRLSQLDSLIR